ncbi:MAG: AMP-binding protein [Acidobacteriota bacterium]|nr:AMP-binding protein [Acidobacteriota bacterium]
MNTLIDLFRTLESRRGECLVYDDGFRVRRHSYADVTAASRGFAAYLSSQGLGRGDKVLIWGENRPEWVVAYWGIQLIGAVAVPIDYRSSSDFVTRIRGLVRARLVLAGDEVEPGAMDTVPLAGIDWNSDGPVPDLPVDRNDVAQIVFTSGATAEPKGVLIRHRNILANLNPIAREIDRYKRYARPFRPIRFLNLLPLSHVFGQAMATGIPPLIDGSVVFIRSLNPHDIVRRVKASRVSVIVCVPKILEVLKEHAARIDPASMEPPGGLSVQRRWWRYRHLHRQFGFKFWGFVVGAAPLAPALEEFWKRLGFVVIQGYGLTETAPAVTINHPFRTRTGSVGAPLAGVEVQIASDGEILVRGENVTTGYYRPGVGSRESGVDSRESAAEEGGRASDAEGWLHTGDIGERDEEGRLFIRGRKKEMIVTPEGLNVFPGDIERALDEQAGVVESAVVGSMQGTAERVHAVLVLAPEVDAETVVQRANAGLADHQRIRGFSLWTSGPLPRTEGTRKLKRTAIKAWLTDGASPAAPAGDGDPVTAVLSKFAGARVLSGDTSLEGLGLSSLDRIELMVALEGRFGTRIDETRFAGARTLDDLRTVVTAAPPAASVHEPVDFPAWNRAWPARWLRRASQFTWILPLTRLVARVTVEGLQHLDGIRGPVVFAVNHQSHLDVPVVLSVLPGAWRARIAPAMAKEFFAAHFHPAQYRWRQVLTSRGNYYLAALFFNSFPLPQREAGARETLRYIGEVTGAGYSVLIFPEGVRSESGNIKPFRGGVGMIAARLGLPVVPVRLEGVDRVLPTGKRMARPGPVSVTFGAPLRLSGNDYGALARQVEQAVRDLPIKGGA